MIFCENCGPMRAARKEPAVSRKIERAKMLNLPVGWWLSKLASQLHSREASLARTRVPVQLKKLYIMKGKCKKKNFWWFGSSSSVIVLWFCFLWKKKEDTHAHAHADEPEAEPADNRRRLLFFISQKQRSPVARVQNSWRPKHHNDFTELLPIPKT